MKSRRAQQHERIDVVLDITDGATGNSAIA
jgi:hypothetical protein